MKSAKMPGIPDIGAGVGSDSAALLEPMKEIIEVREGRRGSRLEKAVTWRDLIRLGLATESDIPD